MENDNSKIVNQKTLYLIRKLSSNRTNQLPNFISFNDLVVAIQKVKLDNIQKIRLLVMQSISNQILNCLLNKLNSDYKNDLHYKLDLKDIADNFMLFDDIQDDFIGSEILELQYNVESFVKKALPYTYFYRDNFLKLLQPKLLWGAKYYLNENTIDDANKYLALVEQIGVILFSNLSQEKKAKKISKLYQNENLCLSENVDRIEIIQSLKDILNKDFGITAKKNDCNIDSFYSLNIQLNILRELQEKIC